VHHPLELVDLLGVALRELFDRAEAVAEHVGDAAAVLGWVIVVLAEISVRTQAGPPCRQPAMRRGSPFS
jgi:hypothetical protein